METLDGDDDETPLMIHASLDEEQERRVGRGRPQGRCRQGLAHVLRPCVAEAVGVSLFVFLGSMSGLSGSLGGVAAAHGLTIMILIIAFGNLSGGHFNPCVTLGVTLGGGLSPYMSVPYVISQLAGSLLGAALTKGILNTDKYDFISGGMPMLGDNVMAWQGILCEMTLTFLLVLMVLMTAVDTKDNILAPLAIGLSIYVDIAAAGSISGAVMNPARAFGPTVAWGLHNGNDAWDKHYIYWLGPSLGAILAVSFYRLILGSNQKRLLCKI